MPNWCYTGIDAVFEDEDAAALAMTLIQVMDDTVGDSGMDMGMVSNGKTDNWLFDRQWTVQGKSIVVTGNVRWGLDDQHTVGLVKWWLDRGAVSLDIDYEEASSNLIGNITYKEGVLTQNALPEDHPWWDTYHNGEDSEAMDNLPENDYKPRNIPITIEGEAA